MLGDRSSYLLPYRFRWVFCQLEVLRHCLPASIRQTLDQLPKSLDETYLRVLSQIPQANQAHAHRMLQCLVVAVRPIRVEELAEILAFEFDAAQGGIPKYRAAWRLDDQTQAVLSTCSSLVTIIHDPWDDCQVVQFSHFSVKEFLISNRLTSPLGDFSQYQIHPGPAHTILTQACLGFLLHLDNHIDKESIKSFPLAEYAARHWVEHAQFEDVASRVKDGMETLFDSDKPHFVAWIGIYDIDTPEDYWRRSSDWEISPKPKPNPLYYSALCGFYDLVKHLAIKHPQHVNGICGRYRFPLLAALSEGRVDVAELLLEHGAEVNRRDKNSNNQTPLLLAMDWGWFEIVRILLEHGADASAENNKGKTPLHLLSENRIHDEGDALDLIWLLLNHGTVVNIRDEDNQTPLHLAMRRDWFKLAQILLEHGADANVENNDGKTPLHLLSESRIHDEGDALDLIWLLLKQGAEVNRRDKDNQTPLFLAMGRDWFKLALILLEHGADANVENKDGKTLLHILSEHQIYDVSDVRDAFIHTRLRLEDGAKVYRLYKDIPLPLEIGTEMYKFA